MKKILIALLMGGFGYLAASTAPSAAPGGATPDDDRKTTNLTASDAAIAAALDETQVGVPAVAAFSRMKIVGMPDAVNYKGQYYQEKFRRTWFHNYEEGSSVQRAEPFITTTDGDIETGEAVSSVFRHLASVGKPLTIADDQLWLKDETLRRVLHRTTNHGQRGALRKNCWNNCDIHLEVAVRSLVRILQDSEEEVIDMRVLKRDPRVEIKDGGREWCTKQDPYNARYEPGLNYFPEAFPPAMYPQLVGFL